MQKLQFFSLAALLVILLSSCNSDQTDRMDNEVQVNTPLSTLQIDQSSTSVPILVATAAEPGPSPAPPSEQLSSPLPTPAATHLPETAPAAVTLSETPVAEVVSDATNAMLETATPATTPPETTLPPVTPIMAIPTNTPAPTFPANALITEANIVAESNGVTTINLPLTINRMETQSPVEEIIYYTSETNEEEDTVETTFWRADVQNINQVQAVITQKYRRGSGGVRGATISPNGRYLIYITAFDYSSPPANLVLFDLRMNEMKILDTGAMPRANSQAVQWIPDNQSIIYIKSASNETTLITEIYQYFLETGTIRILVREENGSISLVGTQDNFVTYLVRELSRTQLYPVKAINLTSGQVQQIAVLEGELAISSIAPSPDGKLARFADGTVMDLVTGTKSTVAYTGYTIWLPDSAGFLVTNPLATIKLPQNGTQVTSTHTMDFILPQNRQDIVWSEISPDGRYLMYRFENDEFEGYSYLVDLQSGQTQAFRQFVSIAGWGRGQ